MSLDLKEWALAHLAAAYPGYGDLATAFPWVVTELPENMLAFTDGATIRLSPDAQKLRPLQYLWLLGHELAHIFLHSTRQLTAADPERLRMAMEIEADQNVPSAFEPIDDKRGELAKNLRRQEVNTLERIYTWLGKNPIQLRVFDEVVPGNPVETRAHVLSVLTRCGQLPGSWRETIEGLKEPTVPWREELAHYVGSRLGNAAYHYGKLVPHYWEMGLPVPPVERVRGMDLVVAVDSSGSMKGEPIRLCLSQIRGLAGLVHDLPVYIVDAVIQDVVHLSEVTDDEIVRLTQAVKGYGGTDFRPVFDALRESPPQLLIYLTDADGMYPADAPEYDVLWVTTTDIEPPFGRRLRIPVLELQEA